MSPTGAMVTINVPAPGASTANPCCSPCPSAQLSSSSVPSVAGGGSAGGGSAGGGSSAGGSSAGGSSAGGGSASGTEPTIPRMKSSYASARMSRPPFSQYGS